MKIWYLSYLLQEVQLSFRADIAELKDQQQRMLKHQTESLKLLRALKEQQKAQAEKLVSVYWCIQPLILFRLT